jgi:hypothetical protein
VHLNIACSGVPSEKKCYWGHHSGVHSHSEYDILDTCTWYLQNTTIAYGNETVISESISDNPDLHLYVLIYGSSKIAVLVSMVIRAFLFVKVLESYYVRNIACIQLGVQI